MKDALGHGSDSAGGGVPTAAHQSMVRKVLASGDLRGALAHAVTGYDRRRQAMAESRGSYYNHYALGHYLGATERIHEDVQKGKSLPDAINAHTNGPLANAIHKALGTGVKAPRY